MFTEEFTGTVKPNTIYVYYDGLKPGLKLVLRIKHRSMILYGIDDVYCVNVTWTPFLNKFKIGLNYEKIELHDFKVGIESQVRFLKHTSVGVE